MGLPAARRPKVSWGVQTRSSGAHGHDRPSAGLSKQTASAQSIDSTRATDEIPTEPCGDVMHMQTHPTRSNAGLVQRTSEKEGWGRWGSSNGSIVSGSEQRLERAHNSSFARRSVASFGRRPAFPGQSTGIQATRPFRSKIDRHDTIVYCLVRFGWWAVWNRSPDRVGTSRVSPVSLEYELGARD